MRNIHETFLLRHSVQISHLTQTTNKSQLPHKHSSAHTTTNNTVQ